ncbi:hypothetical protein WJ12_15985 [Burkholderia seminalis]|uniref:hypothetical protein n=1 Tax=Burkholderia seminalis TaxID=488731 RepID=UPI00075F3BDF|nr:hypothetical protein [Burkholderia seminalis]AOJ26451.1 hypothetical protein WJ12_15985 [Burkholderia seminalis]KVF43739.1 hypothetical protein WJ13_30050 [Burkholderia seminalis]
MTLRVVAETNALSVQKERVARGHGWTILPAVAVTQEIAQRTLSAAPLAPVRCVVGVLLDCVKTTFEQGHWPDARWLG